MKNRDLFIQKLERVEGKLKALDVLITRQGTTTKDIHAITEYCNSELSDIRTMIEREPVNYGR